MIDKFRTKRKILNWIFGILITFTIEIYPKTEPQQSLILFLFYFLLSAEIDFIVILNFDLICNKIRIFKIERTKIKNLDYFYFKDTKKINDIQIRLSQITKLLSFATIFIFVFLINLNFILCRFHSQNIQLPYLMLVIIFCVALCFIVLILSVFSQPILFYISTWIVALLLVNLLGSLHIINKSAYFLIFFLLSLIIELFWTMLLPQHILRIVDRKTLLVSTLITALSTLLIQSSPLLFHLIYPHYQSFSKTFIESLKPNTKLDPSIINTIKNNSSFIDHLFLQYQTSNYIFSIQLWSSILGISILLGILFTTIRISRKTSKTRNILYAYLIDDNTSDEKITYTKLKKLAYDGGNSIEDLIISQPGLLKIIVTNEKNIEIPNSPTLKEKIVNVIRPK